MAHSVLLVGCGNMGFAMLQGWLAQDPSLEAHVVEPADALRSRAKSVGARAVSSRAELPAGLTPDLTFLAVKPQVMGDVVPDYADLAGGKTTFLSVAAGTMMASLAAMLPGDWPIRILDRNIEEARDADILDADLIMVGGMLPQRQDFMHVIAWAQRLGKPVVVGGPDVMSSTHAYTHADFLVV
ncbi:MAG: NAD(P)-binding domain-containing protein, partial [Pseudomonadota bacterium]